MISLIDFLAVANVNFNLDNTKVHLACHNGQEHPIDFYYDGKFNEWQQWQSRQNFRCSQVLSLIDLGQSHWLFVGVFEVLDCVPHPNSVNDFLYTLELLPNQVEQNLLGRIIVRHQRSRQSYVWLRPELQLPIVEIRREKMTIKDFPGYNSVLISYAQLKIIIQRRVASWYGALANIRGIYLITDTLTGKHYVGKASGEVGIWQRWSEYVATGHGGNVKLKALLNTHGNDCRKHFQYSILEIADTHASEDYILARESYWTKALKTREHGLN